MKRLIFAIPLLLCVALPNWAQVTDDSTRLAIQKINAIKLDPSNYLYAEVTMPDWMEAYDAAKSLLKEQLTTWLTEQKHDSISTYVARSGEHFFEIKAKRGNLYRAFVYLKKKDIFAFTDDRQLLVVKPDEIKTTPDNATQIISVKEITDIKEAENPAIAEEAATELKKEPDATITKTETEATGANTATETTEKPYEPSEQEKAMLNVTAFSEIKPYISKLQQEGKITRYGKYANRPENGAYYMYIYSKDATIPAYLKSEDGKITNLATGKEDQVANYKNCGAIWFQMN